MSAGRSAAAATRRFKPYPAYKDSGVEWLGETPAHWDVRRLKFVLAAPLKYGANEAAELDDPDLPRYIRITDIDESDGLRDETFKSLPAEVAREYLLHEGDLLFARSGATAGKTFLYRRSWGACAYAGYLIRARLNTRIVCSEFVRYFTASSSYWQWLSSVFIQATIQNVSAERYASLALPLPPIFEQQAMATFLHRETERIDAMVAKKERLIELLQDKRTALITRAVTKGLDPTVLTNDSNVEWLGEIPAHWCAVRVKHTLIDKISGPFGSSLTKDSYGGSTYRVYGQEQVIPGDFTVGDYYIPESKFRTMKRYAVELGDVLLSCVGTFGRAVVVPEGVEPGIINPRLILLRPDRNAVVPAYLELFLKSELSFAQMDELTRGGTMDIINLSTVSALIMPLPPKAEQAEILEVVRRETSRLDKLLAKVRDAIDRLKELRTALISAAVTGKIDVREEAA